MKTAILVFALAACSGGNQDRTTPAGTTLVSWDATKLKQDFWLKRGTVGPKSEVVTTLATRVDEREIELRVRVQVARISGQAGETKWWHDAPIEVVATVVDSDDTTLDPGTCGALLNLEGQGEHALGVDCGGGAARRTRSSSYSGGYRFTVCGDGRAVTTTDCKPR